jgi:dolichol-phosphate mannosyltransferase
MVQSNSCDSTPAISVVMPVRNEAGNIAPLVAEVEAALEGRAFEVVFVNDGSRDTTEEELRGLMAQRRNECRSEPSAALATR